VPDPRRRAGVVLDERCLTHVNPPPTARPAWAGSVAYERPARLEAIARVLAGSGILDRVVRVPARAASEEELALAHDEAHVARVLAAGAGQETVQLGHEAWVGPGSAGAARVAVGGLLEALRAVLDGGLDTAFVLARPPGHHADAGAAMGFCLFNALAVAARWAQRERGVGRVAILDWDVHHGNGTEAIFREDPSVLTLSLHQESLYPPRTGGLDAGGVANVNVPLPAGTGDDGYAHAFTEVVEPVLRAFGPDLLLLGAGQDAGTTDPLGRMSVTVTGFRAMADRAVALADELCDGRVVAFLEGGYSLAHLPVATLAVLEGLAGLPATFAQDPLWTDVPTSLGERERAAVAAAAAVHAGARR